MYDINTYPIYCSENENVTSCGINLRKNNILYLIYASCVVLILFILFFTYFYFYLYILFLSLCCYYTWISLQGLMQVYLSIYLSIYLYPVSSGQIPLRANYSLLPLHGWNITVDRLSVLHLSHRRPHPVHLHFLYLAALEYIRAHLPYGPVLIYSDPLLHRHNTCVAVRITLISVFFFSLSSTADVWLLCSGTLEWLDVCREDR